MSFDIARLTDEEHRHRWISIMELDADLEIQIRRAGPTEQERFRKKMIAQGIMKKDDASSPIVKMDGFCKAYATQYVTGWRGITIDGVENPEYSADVMGKLLEESNVLLLAITKALAEESAFFSQSTNGSGG